MKSTTTNSASFPAPARPTDEGSRWQAVQARDTTFDGAFVYAVRSTGIYCRPSCPSRRPGREQVGFYDSVEQAEAAGFRACRRCRPREEAARVEAVLRVCRHIEGHLDEPLDLVSLSAAADLSPHHLQRTFRRVVGVSPREYTDALRLERFKAGLRSGEGIVDALFEAGYSSTSRVYERTDGHLGMPPATYRDGGDSVSIAFATAGTSLGRLLVATTAKGICAIALGDSDTELEAGLRREFATAHIERDDAALEEAVHTVVRHVEGDLPDLSLPLDVRATAFQRRVWQELQAIPRGETRSYADVARAIGQPRAFRAVARACATNPVALAVPCHRVVRGDGGLGGYRWGEARKEALLARERRKVQG